MLQSFIPKLIEDLQINRSDLTSEIPGAYTLPLDVGSINMLDIPNGYMLKCNVAPFPKTKEELFVVQAMMGNLFGQGTRGAVLGLNPHGTMLTLTLIVDYPTNFKEFRESLEDFINVMDLWRDEAANPTPLK
jgi:hypothetical protein